MLPDRSLRVPPGWKVVTGYVHVFNCTLANRERMAVGDVDRAFQKLLQLGQESLHPTPNGKWEQFEGRSVFVIYDGRHEYVASVMLGRTYILVTWLEEDAR